VSGVRPEPFVDGVGLYEQEICYTCTILRAASPGKELVTSIELSREALTKDCEAGIRLLPPRVGLGYCLIWMLPPISGPPAM